MNINKFYLFAALLSISAIFSSVVVSQNTFAGNTCGGVDTSLIACDQTGGGGDIENSGVWGILILTIQILSAGVGVLAVGGIVYGSILYTSSGGNPEQTKKAISIITNVVIGLLAYIFMFAIINYLIPGGLFT